jgi:dihydrolipoamide dehydrogenase
MAKKIQRFGRESCCNDAELTGINMSLRFDVIVVGSGPGGYVAAIRASQLGMHTAIVEADELGGICLNWGCIPTKALLKAADVGRTIREAKDYGWEASEPKPNLKKIVAYSRQVSGTLSSGVKFLMKKNGITVVNGWASLEGSGKISVACGDKKENYEADHIILATGARSRTLPSLIPDGENIVTSKEAMIPDSLPQKLLIVGSGAIGVEFASFYNELGSEVTIMEVQDRIVPAEDAEISAAASKAFKKQGITLLTNTKYQSFEKTEKGLKVTFETGNGNAQTSEFDRIISAIGIVGNVDAIGLENTMVQVDRGQIRTDQWMQTNEPGVYAIGDVAGGPWLAHKASHEAVSCVEKIAALESAHPIDKRLIPGCTYSHPQIASVGLTEEQATERGRKVKVGRFPFAGNGKAIALGEPEGLIKLLFDEDTGEVLGAHMIGAEVTELITAIGVAMTLECTEEYLMRTIFPHPTLSEMLHEATLDAFDRAIHI